jgi:(p)ppGpp synthase/HD superfamily hydrolase
MERDGLLSSGSLEARISKEPILQEAFKFAREAHAGQTRSEGTPYFTHLVSVARIIHEEWGIEDSTMIAASFLHDTIEDTTVTKEKLESVFGSKIAEMVEGVSKFRSEKGSLSKEDVDRETIKKITGRNLINPKDVVLKLADRLHNMRTLKFVPSEKQIPKASETFDVYVPLAESLGMWKVKCELEDLAMGYISPEEFNHYETLRNSDERLGDLFIGNMTSRLKSLMSEAGVEARIETRINSLARLKHKMDRTADFAQINDVMSFRVIVDDREGQGKARDDCYKLLGRINETFTSVENPERFDDFFARPKDNGYSAIQVTLNYPFGAVEVAITSSSKEDFNNWGVVSMIKNGKEELGAYVLKVIRTHSGRVKFFPKEATGIDLAYSIDPVMGMRAVNLLIDGEPSPVSSNLPNGALVEVVHEKARPETPKEYMDYCLPATRRIIEAQISEQVRRNIIKNGKKISGEVLLKYGFKNFEEMLDRDQYAQNLMNSLYLDGLKGHLNDLYFAMGAGRKDEDFLENFIKSIIS